MFRTCEFCGCNTNARERACCKKGRKADRKNGQVDTLVNRKKYPKIKFKWWYCIIIGILSIIDGITIILTIGYFPTSFTLKYSLYGATKKIYR